MLILIKVSTSNLLDYYFVELPNQSDVIFVIDSSQALSSSNMEQIKKYLSSILPKYTTNSKISVINTGNDVMEMILSPEDRFADTSISNPLSNLKPLKGKQSLNKAFDYILSNNLAFQTNSDANAKTKIVLLTPGAFDSTTSSSIKDNLVDLREELKAVFTFVVFGDTYPTDRFVRPDLEVNDVILQVTDGGLLPSYLDEIHASIVNSITGTTVSLVSPLQMY